MGMTVSLDVVACFLPREDGKVFIRTEGFRDIVIALDDLDGIEPTSRGMIKGVLKYFVNCGYNVGGFTAILHSSMPSAAGLSSSAAFQMLVAQILNHLYNDSKLDNLTLAKAGQFAETVYFNKPCGLLDQLVVLTGGVVCMDFTNNTAKTLATLPQGLDLVVVNTGKHSRLNCYYATIPADMKSVANFFGKQVLAEVDFCQFDKNKQQLLQTVGQQAVDRAEHFFEENVRVNNAYNACKNDDAQTFVANLNASGNSSMTKLKNCSIPGVTTVLQDAIVTLTALNPNGATRVHGGGFAGTVLCIVPQGEKQCFVAKATELFGAENVHQLKARNVGTIML